ncbi:MAG: PD40 domain-containing protein [Bacteroidales bacterium]|nr:PD40 domain-containing protein [Bacteroidales bacterium]
MNPKSIKPFLVALAILLPLLPEGGLRAQYKVVHLEAPFNTPGSETGALVVGDTVLAFASMRKPESRNRHFNMGDGVMQVYQARIAKSGKIARPRLDRWGINSRKDHTGNLALDPLTQDLYFTRGDVETLRSEIYYAKKKKRRGWEKPVKLKGPVNQPGHTATHPAVGRLADSTVILYFVSDRPGGLGGMDIWYTLIKNGKSGECVNLGPMVNSTADEYTPFYDQRNGVLYFSSDRAGGLGGFDIYCAAGQRNTWQKAEPVCGCLNSEQNDLYFTISQYDSATSMPIAGYLSSNRPDSYFLTDSTCCNDLYRWGVDTLALLRTVAMDTVEPVDTVVQRVRRFMFPLFLYFHNDDPDPRSHEPLTETTYPECQRRYAALRHDYMARQDNAIDSAMMDLFFDTCVVGNYERVEQLFEYVENLLDAGHSITITIAGYASPLSNSEYNRHLSRRRIGSFINMIRAWHNGVFLDALTDGKLFVEQKPHGAVEPTTESRSKDPVYGLPAALARRIEILSCEIR